MKPRESGFTLIEMVIVICIIGILSTIAIMNYLGLKAHANAAQISSNLHVIEDGIIAAMIDGKTALDFSSIDGSNVSTSALKSYLSVANFTQVPAGIKIELRVMPQSPGQFLVFVWVRGKPGTEKILDALQKMFPKKMAHSPAGDFVVVDSATLSIKEVEYYRH